MLLINDLNCRVFFDYFDGGLGQFVQPSEVVTRVGVGGLGDSFVIASHAPFDH